MRSILFWGLFPFVLPQALNVRKNAPRFASARGPKSGTVGAGKPLNLVAIGDSIISGVGASTLEKALVGQTAAALADELDVQINWTSWGSTGASTQKITQRLVPRLSDAPADFIIVSAGVNDVTSLSTVSAWEKQLTALLSSLKKHSPSALIAVAGIPPLRGFPLLPQPLRALFGVRGETFDAAAKKLIEKEKQVVYVPLEFEPRPEFFSADGFHPSEPSYKEFGKLMADKLAAAFREHN